MTLKYWGQYTKNHLNCLILNTLTQSGKSFLNDSYIDTRDTMTGFQDESNGSENRTVEKTDERQITPFEIQSFHFWGKYCQKHYFVLNRSWWKEHTLATFSSFYPPIYMSLSAFKYRGLCCDYFLDCDAGNGSAVGTCGWAVPPEWQRQAHQTPASHPQG